MCADSIQAALSVGGWTPSQSGPFMETVLSLIIPSCASSPSPAGLCAPVSSASTPHSQQSQGELQSPHTHTHTHARTCRGGADWHAATHRECPHRDQQEQTEIHEHLCSLIQSVCKNPCNKMPVLLSFSYVIFNYSIHIWFDLKLFIVMLWRLIKKSHIVRNKNSIFCLISMGIVS